MNYSNVVTAFRDAMVGDGTAVAMLVEARCEAGFNSDQFMVSIDAMLIELVLDGFIADGTAKTRTSMIKKLATCELGILVDAAALTQGLNSVYRAVCDASPKTSNKGAKRKVAAIAAVDTAKADAKPLEIVSLMDMLAAQRALRAALHKMTASMAVGDAFDAFIATLVMECKVKAK